MAVLTETHLYVRGAETLLASWEEYARGATGASVQRFRGAAAVFPVEPSAPVPRHTGPLAHWPARKPVRLRVRASFGWHTARHKVASGSGRLERCDVCFPRFGVLEAAFGRDSCLHSTFEGESRLTAAAGEVWYGDSRLAPSSERGGRAFGPCMAASVYLVWKGSGFCGSWSVRERVVPGAIRTSAACRVSGSICSRPGSERRMASMRAISAGLAVSKV